VVLYQMLAGKNPFKGNQASETLHRVLTHVPTPLSVLREDVSPEVDAAIMRAIAKNPDERFESAAAFIEALRTGRTRTEEQVIDEFVAVVSQDFQGELPDLLELETLDSRDRAWREAQDGPPTGRISLSSSPPLPPSDPDLLAPMTVPDGPMSMRTQTLDGRRKVDSTGATAPAPIRGLRWMALALGVLALAGGVGFGMTVMQRAPAPQASTRFLVIEKESSDQGAPAGSAATNASAELPAAASSPSASQAPKSAPSAAAAVTGKPTASGGGAAALSRAFQRQQGRIEQCFRTHTKDIDGQPRIAVRFAIDPSGAVKSAQLNPASLSGTPLGGCILAAARSTDFGPQSESLTFTIPITARRSP
jgi:hypothetical protein